MKELQLYLDLQIAQSQWFRERGSIRYAVEHARSLVKKRVVRAIGLHPHAPFPQSLDLELRSFPGLRWSTAAHFREAESKGPMAFYMMSPFAPSHSEYLLPPWALKPEVPLIVTLVDLTPLSSEDRSLREPRVARRYRSRFRIVEQADLVLTISRNTAEEARRLLEIEPSRVINIGTGVSEFFSPSSGTETSPLRVKTKTFEISRPYVLSLTGTWEWKNTQRLIEAYARLSPDIRKNLQLVIVCRLTDAYRQRWTEHAARCGLQQDEMILTDLVSDPVLRSLYRGAELFVYPSLYEGFGLPAAEAAACGCPIIVSNTSSMPEIANFPPGTFHPTDVDDITALMARALTDDDFQQQLHRASREAAARNTWDAVADRTVGALESLRARSIPAISRSAGGARVAVAGVFELNGGHEELQTMGVLKELGRICRLDLFNAGGGSLDPLRQIAGARIFQLEALGRHLNPGSYDAIIYQLDPGAASPQLCSQALHYPGVVWINRTPGVFFPSFGHEPSTVSTVIRAARGVVASSPAERRLLELDQGPLARRRAAVEISPSAPDELIARELLDFALGPARQTT